VGVEIERELVPFSLEEDVLRTEKPPTQAEKKDRERYGWLRPTYVYTPTGALTLALDVHIRDGERRRWSDGKKRRVEDHLPAIAEAFLRFAAHLKEQRRVFEEERRRREEHERQRAEKLKLIREEEERLGTLLTEVDSWRRSRQIHAYVNAAVEQLTGHENPERLSKWAAWARNHADRFNALVQAEPSILDEKGKWERGY
jgi:PAS domain-containing protein